MVAVAHEITTSPIVAACNAAHIMSIHELV
jgi:hypothetical protein